MNTDMVNVPFVVYEAAGARYERITRRSMIVCMAACIIAVIAIVMRDK